MSDIHLADLQAVGDVLDWVCEASDSMTVETAIEFSVALTALIAKARMAQSLCETAAKTMLDGQPALIGDTLYVEKATGKWRPDQSRIRARVVGMSSCNPETGELVTAPEAAERAVNFMYTLFVSPSTMPKVGGLDLLGLDKRDVADWEKTGSELSAVQLKGQP